MQVAGRPPGRGTRTQGPCTWTQPSRGARRPASDNAANTPRVFRSPRPIHAVPPGRRAACAACPAVCLLRRFLVHKSPFAQALMSNRLPNCVAAQRRPPPAPLAIFARRLCGWMRRSPSPVTASEAPPPAHLPFGHRSHLMTLRRHTVSFLNVLVSLHTPHFSFPSLFAVHGTVHCPQPQDTTAQKCGPTIAETPSAGR